MRNFPRARSSVPGLAVVVLAGVLFVPGPSSGAGDPGDPRELRQQQQAVQRRIAAAGDALADSTAQVSAAGVALAQAQAELAAARTHRAEVADQLAGARADESRLEAELAATRERLAQARRDLAAGRAAATAQRDTVADTVASLYEQGDPRLLAVSALMQARTPADLTRQMGLDEVVVDKQDTAYDDLVTARRELAAGRAEVVAAEADVDARTQAATAHVAEVADLEADAAAAEQQVAGLVQTQRQARRDARSSRDADAAALLELQRQERQVKKQILAAKAAALAAAAAARAAQQPDPTYTGPTDGLVLAPVVGPVTSPFGYRRHPIYGYWGLHDGTDFGVACGEPLRASGNGKVLSTYYSSSYGNRLYLDLGIVNGKAVTVVYNHLSGYAAAAGDTVQRGETVGYVGSTGWSTGCHLHFTVLEDGVAVDPMTYL